MHTYLLHFSLHDEIQKSKPTKYAIRPGKYMKRLTAPMSAATVRAVHKTEAPQHDETRLQSKQQHDAQMTELVEIKHGVARLNAAFSDCPEKTREALSTKLATQKAGAIAAEFKRCNTVFAHAEKAKDAMAKAMLCRPTTQKQLNKVGTQTAAYTSHLQKATDCLEKFAQHAGVADDCITELQTMHAALALVPSGSGAARASTDVA